jgi:hypothetical protein
VAELADAKVSKTFGITSRVGSIPTIPTITRNRAMLVVYQGKGLTPPVQLRGRQLFAVQNRQVTSTNRWQILDHPLRQLGKKRTLALR